MSMSGSKIAGANPSRGRVENDYYATPREATLALLEMEDVLYPALEPACGEGHISKQLEDNVFSCDLVDRGYGVGGVDFLKADYDRRFRTVITNPPFNMFLDFLKKALDIAEDKVILFGKLQALEGRKRGSYFEKSPLKYVYVFKNRQQPLRNGSDIDPKTGKQWASSTMAFAWFVWEKKYVGEPMIRWLETGKKYSSLEQWSVDQLPEVSL